jgi:hypothetical protein
MSRRQVEPVAHAVRPIVFPAEAHAHRETAQLRCTRSRTGGFDVEVLSGHDQYFTLWVGGKVVARLVYRNVD